MATDILRLRNMRFFAYHGLFPEEEKLGQHYEVDVEFFTDLSVAGTSDYVEKTINYPEAYAIVEAVVTGERFNLVEALAEAIAARLGERFAPIELLVRVRKPNPPVAAHFDGIEVEMRRAYA